MQLHFQYNVYNINKDADINAIKALKMGSIQFCMTMFLLSHDSMIYLNLLYDLQKALEKDECIQNPGTLATYISRLEKGRNCAVLLG